MEDEISIEDVVYYITGNNEENDEFYKPNAATKQFIDTLGNADFSAIDILDKIERNFVAKKNYISRKDLDKKIKGAILFREYKGLSIRQIFLHKTTKSKKSIYRSLDNDLALENYLENRLYFQIMEHNKSATHKTENYIDSYIKYKIWKNELIKFYEKTYKPSTFLESIFPWKRKELAKKHAENKFIQDLPDNFPQNENLKKFLRDQYKPKGFFERNFHFFRIKAEESYANSIIKTIRFQRTRANNAREPEDSDTSQQHSHTAANGASVTSGNGSSSFLRPSRSPSSCSGNQRLTGR